MSHIQHYDKLGMLCIQASYCNRTRDYLLSANVWTGLTLSLLRKRPSGRNEGIYQKLEVQKFGKLNTKFRHIVAFEWVGGWILPASWVAAFPGRISTGWVLHRYATRNELRVWCKRRKSAQSVYFLRKQNGRCSALFFFSSKEELSKCCK